MKRTRLNSRGPNFARKHKANQATKRERQKRRNGVVGKAGIVRLKGEKLEALRQACFYRDGYHCRECSAPVTWDTGEMAHIRTKRNNGDTLDNVRTLCKSCHSLEHNPKACPKKGTR